MTSVFESWDLNWGWDGRSRTRINSTATSEEESTGEKKGVVVVADIDDQVCSLDSGRVDSWNILFN